MSDFIYVFLGASKVQQRQRLYVSQPWVRVLISHSQGQSAACWSPTDRPTEAQTDGQTAGGEKGRWGFHVWSQETYHLPSPWHRCGDCSPEKGLAPRPPGAALCDARSVPTAPSHQGALSGYLQWAGWWGVKRSLVRRSLSSGYHVKSRSYSCKQIFQPRSFFFSFFAVFMQHGTNSTPLNFICVCYQEVAGTRILRWNADKEWLTKEGGLTLSSANYTLLLISHFFCRENDCFCLAQAFPSMWTVPTQKQVFDTKLGYIYYLSGRHVWQAL